MGNLAVQHAKKVFNAHYSADINNDKRFLAKEVGATSLIEVDDSGPSKKTNGGALHSAVVTAVSKVAFSNHVDSVRRWSVGLPSEMMDPYCQDCSRRHPSHRFSL